MAEVGRLMLIYCLLALAIIFTFAEETGSSSNLKFTIDCDPARIATCDSSSLETIATSINSSGALDVTISIRVASLSVKGLATFRDIQSIVILGENSQLVCDSKGSSALRFLSVENITLQDIEVINCGTLVRGGSPNSTYSVQTAIYFRDYDQITIREISVAQSNGCGIHFEHTRGHVHVINSNFVNNTLREEKRGGNGVRVNVRESANASEITFENCNFTQNVANGIKYDFIFSTLEGVPISGRGRGGGMIVTLRTGATEVKVILKGCSFISNSAFLGAGLSAEIEGGGRDNEVLIEDTEFIDNGCPSEAQSGGGVYLSFENLGQTTNHKISLIRVVFDSNCAKVGGGAYFFSSRSEMPNNNSIQFDYCTWINNSAHTGSAIDITPNIFSRNELGYLPKPRFINCSFIENTILSENQESFGTGTLYLSLVSVTFESSVMFINNFGSAIVIVNGIADFVYSNATFIGNTGVQGGAIELVGTASMLVGAGQEYMFVNNTAADKGGAIYSYLVDDKDFTVSRSCFLQYRSKQNKEHRITFPTTNWTATLTFKGNSARSNIGNSIYATSVIPCQVVSSPAGKHQTVNISDIFQPPGIMGIRKDDRNEIATEGTKLILRNSLLKAIPGKQIELGVRILDDFRNEVGATLTAFVAHGDIKVDSISSCIRNQTIKIHGKEGNTGELVLQTLGSRKRSLNLSVHLLHCPPGYKLEQESCMCDAYAYVGMQDCQDYTAFLTPGFWAGYVNATDDSKELVTSICPKGFCKYDDTDLVTKELNRVGLPRDRADLDEAMCGKKRKGVLCGECRENFTVYYHSPNLNCNKIKPYSCKIGWLFYILSELVPVTVLFFLVLVLNISFTTGAVNGFILFSQLLDTLSIEASGIIVFSPPITVLSTVYKVIYGFFSLNFFNIEPLSFCIWENASVLDMLSFKYITIAYSLLLVLGVIFFMRYCAARCLGRYYSITSLRNSVIHGLSAFLVLCYGQCIKVSFSILYGKTLSTRIQNSTSQSTPPRRVWFSGNVEYFSNEHLPYALPAFFILLTIGAVPPLVLLVYPLFNRVFAFFKLENLRIVRCFNRIGMLKPLLDSFQGSFKDDFRFFAGIYFFYRWTAVVIYASVSSYNAFFNAVQAFLVGILTVHSLFQPYQKRWHNILDGLLLANLIVINGFTAIHYYQVRVYRSRNIDEVTANINITGAIQLIFIYLPLVYITLYAIVCILGKTVCKVTKEDSSGRGFALEISKKIYHKSFSASESDANSEESLPYRLVGREDTSFFENTENSKDIIDT